jgi:hypothetical protein
MPEIIAVQHYRIPAMISVKNKADRATIANQSLIALSQRWRFSRRSLHI